MMPVHRPFLADEELRAVARVFESRWLGMGAVTLEFEERLREFLTAGHVIAVSSGTAALHLALHALELQPGAEVIVPSLTFVSSVQAILAVGATPVFCEIADDTLNLDVTDALRRVTRRTRAIMPVHYGGLACEMDALLSPAHVEGIRVIEDAAHAFGSTYKKRMVGTLGDVTCFSFDAIKNITCGSGGALVTADAEVARRVRARCNLGVDRDSWSRRQAKDGSAYKVTQPGFRYHMNDLNAAIGLEQFKRLSEFRARKQAIVRQYDEALRELPGLLLLCRNLDQTFPFSYVIRVLDGRRDALRHYLRQAGIDTAVQFTPNHLQPMFAPFHDSLPVTEKVSLEIVTLPLYFEMTDAQVERVIAAVQDFLTSGS